MSSSDSLNVAEVAEVAGSGHDSWNDKQDEDFD